MAVVLPEIRGPALNTVEALIQLREGLKEIRGEVGIREVAHVALVCCG